MFKSIKIRQFSNLSELNLLPSEHINLICGENGSGKTNLLNAIYYLCLTKCAFNRVDKEQVKRGENFFGLTAITAEQDKLHLSFQAEGNLKTLKINDETAEKLSVHIGSIPVVLMTPMHEELISEGSDERRKYLDFLLAQSDKEYLVRLNRYNKVLKLRNALCKSAAERKQYDSTLLQVYTESLMNEIPYIFEQRQSLVSEIQPVFNELYSKLSQRDEQVSIQYSSIGNEEFSLTELYELSLHKDLSLGRTTQGIHRDDLVFSLNGEPVKRFASQGQRKTFLVALKLAQYHLLKQRTKKTPVLLLDDVFDKLDDNRISLLITELNSHLYGQVFISDARPERSTELLSSVEFTEFKLHQGQLSGPTKAPE